MTLLGRLAWQRWGIPVVLSTLYTVGCGQGSGETAGTGGSPSSPGGGAATGTAGSNPTGGSAGAISGGSLGADAGGGAQGTDTSGGNGGAGTNGGDTGFGGSGGSTSAGGASGGTGGTTSAGAGGMTTGGAGLNSGAGPWGTPVSGGPVASAGAVTGTVTVTRSSVKGKVGPGFAGFSFEKTHLTNSTFTGTNASMIALMKLIGPASIRIGANDVDNCSWVPGAKPAGGAPPYGYGIGTAMVDQLADFLQASGAQIIYAVNFKANDVAKTVAEATYAASKLGTSVTGFEIGNEIDKYNSWAAQKTQWETFGTAILKAVPNALLIGPACTSGSSVSFTTPFAADESAKFGSKLGMLTQHYYLGGATSTAAVLPTLQTIKSNILTISSTLNDASTKNHVPNGWRMGETNTFSGHGKAGLSDTLIAGLWSLDYMFEIALNGGSGVNFHGAETGMDGTTPFAYEPIQEQNGAVAQAMPLFHGMLLFYLAGQGDVLATSVMSSNPNFTAYALDYKADHSTSVVLVNKNATQGVTTTIDVGSEVASASAIYLQGTPANSLTAGASAVTLAGAHVTASGSWGRSAPFSQATSGHTVTVFVPPATAALVRVL